MRAEYKRDMNHNYLILYGEKEVDTSSYQIRMLVGNVLPSILKCRIQSLDGNLMFYYEITSKQSISSLYEQKKFKMEDLKLILGGFIQAMEEMGEYLLNPGQLVLDPDYVFMDVEKRTLHFCCLPGYEKEVQEQFRSFTEYILPKLDHEDGRAVMLGYGVYRSALEDSFHLEYIKKELYQVREGMMQENSLRNADFYNSEKERAKADCEQPLDIESGFGEVMLRWEEEAEKNGKSEKDQVHKSRTKPGSENKKETKVNIWVIIGVISAAVVMLGIVTASLMGYLPWLNVEVTMGTGLIILGGSLLGYIISRRKRARAQQNWREEVQKNRKFREKQEAILGKAEPSKEKQDAEQEDGEVRRILPEEVSGETVQEIPMPADKNSPVGETVVLSANVMSGPASLVSREPGELATIYLKEDLTIIGKLENACDAVIPLPTVSRVHGKIRKRGGEYYLADLNSRNGTSVNGRMLKGDEEYCLQEEDEVDFAQARYVFLK